MKRISRVTTLAAGCLLLLAIAACRLLRPEATVPSGAREFDSARLAELDEEIHEAIAEGKLPGGVLWIGRAGRDHQRAYGNRAIDPAVEPMTADTVFDAASLTKAIATAPSVMKLMEQGKVGLDAPVRMYLPEFTGEGRETVTVRQLLTHTSGLRPGLGARGEWSGAAKAVEFACAERLRTPPDEKFVYSDINFILLGELVRRVSGRELQVFARDEFFRPLGMKDTGFLPATELRSRIAPTERLKDGTVLRGVVHDPTSRRMGGVAGHAGLFTTASDLARFARMMLGGGELDGARVLRSETVALMTVVQTPATLKERRGLGWDIDTAYSGPRGQRFAAGSFGHTGWTGTSIWMDPSSQSFVIFLANRNHPTEKGSVVPLRKRIATLAADAMNDFDFAAVRVPYPANFPVTETLPSNKVLNGIDVLKRRNFAPLKGSRIGLVTNHTGRDRKGNTTIDLLHRSPELKLVALFSPEHGIRGELDEKVADGRDAQTGLPVYSLYGERRAPAPEQLAGLDALVFDIQDIGCRFYTYVSTMGLCLEAAGKAGLRFVVLDRVNPINGTANEGPLHVGKPEFVAFHKVPLRHGLTAGELARMFNAERGWNANLEVVPLAGWKRDMWFDETGLPWRNPSPNMRNLTAATFYPGVGLVEFSISVGRGTPSPFEILGAPYVDENRLAAELTAAKLPGVRFEPTRFTPESSVFKGESCGGVKLLLTDRHVLNSVDLGIVIASALQRLYPGRFALDKVDRLLRHPPTLEAIRAGQSLAEIKAGWNMELGDFQARRRAFLIYP